MSIDKVQEKLDTVLNAQFNNGGIPYDYPGKDPLTKKSNFRRDKILEILKAEIAQAEARGREERDRYWLKRMNDFERINKLPKDKIAGWSWLKTQLSDLLTKLGETK